MKYGFLYQGQINTRQSKRRGTPTFGLDPATFIVFLQNHDQVGNSAAGVRLDGLTSPGRYRAITAVMLLAPGTPMLFQGQEFAASSPFLYFGDQKPEIADLMHKGRKEFLTQFKNLATEQMQERIPHPGDPETFLRSKLDPTERERGQHAEAFALHRDLLRLRRDDPVFSAQRPGGLDGAVLAPEAFVLRYFGEHGDDRLLVVNLGPDAAPRPGSGAAPRAAGREGLEDPLVERRPRVRRDGHRAAGIGPRQLAHPGPRGRGPVTRDGTEVPCMISCARCRAGTWGRTPPRGCGRWNGS